MATMFSFFKQAIPLTPSALKPDAEVIEFSTPELATYLKSLMINSPVVARENPQSILGIAKDLLARDDIDYKNHQIAVMALKQISISIPDATALLQKEFGRCGLSYSGQQSNIPERFFDSQPQQAKVFTPS